MDTTTAVVYHLKTGFYSISVAKTGSCLMVVVRQLLECKAFRLVRSSIVKEKRHLRAFPLCF